ncbi:DNA-binding protein inhibitor ID-2 [Lingula anatina]|uniref:DNA-binding protein inhibitor ID-2 n=1 Tax=Lingula anatina TaxID=7574 RepID=A0A1S3JAP3_LINAN|nr:DNA-binding protein inhibitor ID-2 [Lingula anatina]|eukprot:XP_013407266.1 DNA-binding protein inhibitor ID-2 [Lingula anatina]
MKAQMKETIAAEHPALNTLKAKITKEKNNDAAAEIQACFAKLKDLVPTVPQNKKVSKVALIQHVIDYIMDLESALDYHPMMNLATLSSLTSGLSRPPLIESSQLNKQESSYTEEMEASDADSCESRPPSC